MRRVRPVAVGLALTAASALMVALSGAISVKASSGHLRLTAWMLDFVKVRSVATRALGIDTPSLDDAGLVRVGAGHYDRGCRPCHGVRWERVPVVPARMTPHPPDLAAQVGRWRARELFYLVAHGIKFTGMPAWPAPTRTDEVWAVVAFLRQMPEMDAARYAALTETARDAGDATSDLARCEACHRSDHPQVPRLAGQSPAYLRATLDAYAAGQRYSGVMQTVASAVDPQRRAQLAEMLATSARADPGTTDVGWAARSIVFTGDPARAVPACAECHGPGGRPRDPRFPRLSGQSAVFIEAQLRLFAEGRRGGTSYADIMRPIAQRLTAAQRREAADVYARLGVSES
jgi:cytochrome c553